MKESIYRQRLIIKISIFNDIFLYQNGGFILEKQRPGIARACSFIINLAEHEAVMTKLPSLRALASAAGVSFVTMWKAVKKLCTQGVLSVDKKGNYRISKKNSSGNDEEKKLGVPSASSDEPIIVGTWQNIADKLFKDIVSGKYTGGEKLPSCKELQQYYKVSFTTLKKALNKLIEEEIIEPRSNGYYLPSLTGSTGHARLVAIGCGWEDGKILVDYQDKNYFRSLESECIRMNLQLDVIVYYRSNERLQFVNTASQSVYDLNDRTIIGYVFIVANLESTPEEVLERLVGLRRNVAVLDVVGGWKVPRCAQDNRFVQIFTATASVVPAKRVAQYLLGKGHKNIAFFSPFHKALWSQRRLDTIIDMYKRAGCIDGVKSFVYETYAYQWDYLKNQEHFEDIRSLIDQYTKWRKQTHAEFFNKFGNLGYSIVKYITEWNCASGEIFEKMKPLFDRALKNKDITAWVMANDFAATIAIDYLKEKSIRIPEDLSIVSFDNTLDAMEYHLTSYDFNNQGIIAMMLRYIIAPHTIKPAARRGGFIEVDGTLVERRSTSNVKGT
jgi:DNA-binding LacI/PurR family transcriptional regulator/DNA-binding transcriptional regulator YhcF (GntR family)